ncbi:MAG: 2-hydroxyacid dehydrogenase [Armatimonadota bacterium]
MMAQFTVYVTRRIEEHARQKLAAIAHIQQWNHERPVPHAELLAQIADVDGLLCLGDDDIDRDIIMAGRHLQVISTASAGVNHINLDAAAERDITVCHTPGVAEQAVADLTMALLLACARDIVDAHNFVKNREWKYWSPELFLGENVQGSTLAIIGLGSIGLQVAHRALGFGMRVFYYHIRRNHDAEERLGIQYGELDDVLREADFVTLHVPLTEDTRGLINADRLQLMKTTAYLINMARGPVVDHDALVQALREGWIAGAAFDVYDQEPIAVDDPLLDQHNVVLSPHLGANTREAMTAMMRVAAEQVVQVLEGKRPTYPVRLPPRRGRKAA